MTATIEATIEATKERTSIVPEISVCICKRHGQRPDGELLCQGPIADPHDGVVLKCGAACEIIDYTPKAMAEDSRWIGRSKDEVIEILEQRLGECHHRINQAAADCQQPTA